MISAPTAEYAKEIGDAAEAWRDRLAEFWTGKKYPAWSSRCRLIVSDGNPGGSTTFTFEGGQVFGWVMTIRGPRDRVLDSILPHEISHTILATHFRERVPRWVDEGACSLMECRDEQQRLERDVVSCLKTGRGIPFNAMMAMDDYPVDVGAFYAQGHSVSAYLFERSKSPQDFLKFVGDAMRDGNWQRALSTHYGIETLADFQNQWVAWVRAGRPEYAAYGRGVYVGAGVCIGGQCWAPGYGWSPYRPQPVRPTQPPPQTFAPIQPPSVDQPPVGPDRPEPTIDEQAWEEWEQEQQKLREQQAQLQSQLQSLVVQVENAPPGPPGPVGPTGPQGPPGDAAQQEPFYIRVRNPKTGKVTPYAEVNQRDRYVTIDLAPIQ